MRRPQRSPQGLFQLFFVPFYPMFFPPQTALKPGPPVLRSSPKAVGSIIFLKSKTGETSMRSGLAADGC